jgi:predicted house-cleaning noncanonical NTP pyrophosphatase (MazG superfamily)
MPRKTYNKLVRDGIPFRLNNRSLPHQVRILSAAEYKIALRQKLGEECAEVIGAKDRAALIGELADLAEVVRALAVDEGLGLDEIEAARIKKFIDPERGGLEKKIMLEWVEEK